MAIQHSDSPDAEGLAALDDQRWAGTVMEAVEGSLIIAMLVVVFVVNSARLGWMDLGWSALVLVFERPKLPENEKTKRTIEQMECLDGAWKTDGRWQPQDILLELVNGENEAGNHNGLRT